ncbi:OmpA family protein [Parazoarcus communis]|uniref:OmpA-like domain-containing protein n=1 Tax=Parazoarcus communis SWub3 = DSM 12120 TaxID=1121029 RepID=A0A323UQJ4_9RHOO|nr:OmpA family protein [Parazoarcus communis]NMG72859.1 OmpA family protein [Parazoarcus communis SWub3 = DSM 12120]PZA14293.1 hypothetical protein DNK49_22630 [Azoarcus communis] [Parazoarcus communis SWub3 = DSM 12120]
MEKLFEIASNVSTPLGLGGLFAAILFYIFKQILTRDFVRQMTTAHSADVIKLIIERLFTLALVAMILGFIAYTLTKLMPRSAVSQPAVPTTAVHTSSSSPTSTSQPSAPDNLDNEQRYELITLAQNGCYFFVPGEAKVYSVMEYIELAQEKFIEQIDGSDARIKIVGYMETGYSDMYAQKLSEKRAEAVKQLLISRYRIDAARISTEGHGMKHNQKWVREYFCGARVSITKK